MIAPAPTTRVRSRLAPSPTGLLHLGHVAHMLWLWGATLAEEGEVVIRIEDHDRGRSRPAFERQLLEDLAWLGFRPEATSLASLVAGPSPWRQSDSDVAYTAALDDLSRRGLVYGCTCSRSTIARELGDGLTDGRELRYPGTCRDKGVAVGPGVGVRVRLPEGTERFTDLWSGEERQDPQAQCGDLLIRDRAGSWTYQFAVTVDDLRHGISLVVRGEDLRSSTGRQLALARLLGRTTPPRFLHHPLVRNADGLKLNKRDRAEGLAELRGAGRSAADVLGEAAWRAGLLTAPRPVSADEAPALVRAALLQAPGAGAP